LDSSFRVVAYPADEFPLSSAVAAMLGVEDLMTSHETLAAPPERFVRATDQSTVLHERFYAAASEGFPLYEAFARCVLVSLAEREPVYLQRIPNLRVQLPGNIAVGEFHRDSDYGHPDGELNVWVPLTSCERSNTIWVAPDTESKNGRPWVLNVGEALRFDGRNLLHGNVPNTTGATRVSLDFRYLPCRKLDRSSVRSVNTGMLFRPGDYYLSDPVVPS
jgi:ectoine hydroxylase-related dioxygenase (phytanoyl-CoA dioxygenase family)